MVVKMVLAALAKARLNLAKCHMANTKKKPFLLKRLSMDALFFAAPGLNQIW
jgi:hypothetical protein